MMLVSYRPLAAGVLLALLERYMRVDRGDEGSVGPTALIRSIQVVEQGEMPAIARLGKRYGAPSGIVVRVPRVSDPKFAGAA